MNTVRTKLKVATEIVGSIHTALEISDTCPADCLDGELDRVLNLLHEVERRLWSARLELAVDKGRLLSDLTDDTFVCSEPDCMCRRADPDGTCAKCGADASR